MWHEYMCKTARAMRRAVKLQSFAHYTINELCGLVFWPIALCWRRVWPMACCEPCRGRRSTRGRRLSYLGCVCEIRNDARAYSDHCACGETLWGGVSVSSVGSPFYGSAHSESMAVCATIESCVRGAGAQRPYVLGFVGWMRPKGARPNRKVTQASPCAKRFEPNRFSGANRLGLIAMIRLCGLKVCNARTYRPCSSLT